MHPATMTLAELQHMASDWGAEVWGERSRRCTHVTQDSRRVRPGAMFAVVDGTTHDGLQYVPAALEAGAESLLVDKASSDRVLLRFAEVPALVVSDLSAALGPLAHAALGYPGKTVAVTGITGTNGKTTIVGLLRQCFEAVGRRAASLGTLGYRVGDEIADFGMTTPNADLVAEYLYQASSSGVEEFAMEVSSHALALGRVEGFTFEVGGYVNLTQDHLDFHGSFEAYAAAKQRLFEDGRCKRAVIYGDDPHLAALAARMEGAWGERLLRVGASPGADLQLTSCTLGLHETRFRVEWRGSSFAFRTKLLGEHNVANWLVALGALALRGIDLADLVDVVPGIEPAPGRLQRCDTERDDVCVLVDYAHTPDALERALIACRALRPSAIWCVFGCGGDRDRAKRPLMGEVASRLAEVAIITNDNPRTESPEHIAEEIRRGTTGDVLVLLDRGSAIEYAVTSAAPGDLILVAGKGHENYQIFGRTRVAFDDREQAIQALAKRRKSPRPPAKGT